MQLWATNAFQAVLRPLDAQLEQAAGSGIRVTYRSSNAIMAQVAQGERADAVIATCAAVRELAARGIVDGESIRELATAALGLGVRAGAGRPDVSSAAAVRSALLAVHSVAYSATGASAAYFLEMVERLGISSEVKAKAIVYEGGLVGDLVACGEVELGAQMVSEIVAVPGVALVGPLPAEFRKDTPFCAAVFRGARRPTADPEVTAFLAAAGSRPLYEAAGMTPAG
jgi:molybdate transport system substrate-binding protein